MGNRNDVLIDKRELRSRRHAWYIIKRATFKDRRLTDVLAERIRHGNFTDQEKRFITEIVQGTVLQFYSVWSEFTHFVCV